MASVALALGCSSDPAPADSRDAGSDASAGSSGAAGSTSGGSSGAGGSAAGSGGRSDLCGNGVLDPGETCDESAIPQAGASAGGAGATGGVGGLGGAGGSAGSRGGSGGSATGGTNATGGSGGSSASGGTNATGGSGGSSASGGTNATGGSGGSNASGGTGGIAGSATGGSSASGGSSATGGSGGSNATGGTAGTTPQPASCVRVEACPPASSACFRPAIVGSAATCDARCGELPVTTCTNGDGCCAPGCAPSEDDDCAVWSCDPSATLGGAAYASMEDLSKDALRTALRAFVGGQTALGYDSARDYMFNTLDVHDGSLECVYTGRLVPPDGTRIPSGFNTEHSWPQSEGAASGPANSDLHHLFPSDEIANNERGNWPFGETVCQTSACPFFAGGSERGPDSGGAMVFQVRPQRRGDIARAHFYFSVRYNLPIDPAEEAVLRAWHCQDPPDAVERTRNDGIEAVQHNRNPFVDRPDFAQRLLDF